VSHSLAQAVQAILAAVPPATLETISLPLGRGRVLLQDMRAAIDLPAFDNSAMDGYAVRAEDLQTASANQPTSLKLAGRIPAGEVLADAVRGGECVRIFTGSALPSGTDAVVMQEDTVDQGQTILFRDRVAPGENIRRRGEDLAQGSVIAQAGTRLSTGHLAVLAATGVGQVPVGRRPRVAVLATGSELQEAGGPVRPGHIYESNRITVAALAEAAGALPRVQPIVQDTLAATIAALEAGFAEAEMVVTCGGVSVGEMDFVKQAFLQTGGAIEFWRVSIKPGRPFVFGRLGEKLLFGLPGNPVSAFVTFLLLVRPALARWQGASRIEMTSLPGVLSAPLENPDGRTHYVRVSLDCGQVHLAGLQASHIVGPLARANGLVELPPQSNLPAGSPVHVLVWELPG
jgi:molybdopterin molybdotransferase